MIVYTGRRGLHIYDIDRENWVFNSNRPGYNYQDIYYKARGISDESNGDDSSEFNESGEEDIMDEQVEEEKDSSSETISQHASEEEEKTPEHSTLSSIFKEIMEQI